MNLIIDILRYIPSKLLEVFYFVLDWFLGINFFEKLVVLNGITAVFAVILPSAKYFIFDSWYTTNNPMSVYMIGVAFYMFVSIFLHGKLKLISRMLILLYFTVWTLYHHYINPFVKCEHVIMAGYYLNYITVLIYALASFFSYASDEK